VPGILFFDPQQPQFTALLVELAQSAYHIFHRLRLTVFCWLAAYGCVYSTRQPDEVKTVVLGRNARRRM